MQTSSFAASVPLRERQRLEAWRAIHEAAATLVLDRGLTDATVELIAERAGVSRRTFFNYFATKEDAVLGLQTPELPEAALTDFRAGDDDILGDAVRLMTAAVRSTSRLSRNRERRRELVGRYPELRARLDHHLGTAEALIAPLLAERSSASGEADQRESTTKALLMLTATMMRFAYWHNPDEVANANEEVVDEAIEIFRTAVRAVL